MKRLPIKLLLLPLIMFCLLSFAKREEWQEPEHVKAYNKMIIPFVNTICKKENLIITCTSGELMHNVKTVDLRFVSYKSLSLEEARKLFVRCNESLLQYINEHEKIRPYLVTYPFTIKDIDITISFKNPKSFQRVDSEFIALIFISKGIICYNNYNLETKQLETVHEETYEEAWKIVQGTQ